MADSSCSGSTPFKSLVEHGSRDRSLHQDRVSGAPAVQHTFRSFTSASSAQAQDAFGAFLTSNNPGHHSIPLHGPSVPNGFAGLQPPQMAADQHSQSFTPGRFPLAPHSRNATSVAAVPTPYQQHQASNTLSEASKWAQDFARFSQGSSLAGSQVPTFADVGHDFRSQAGFPPNVMTFPSGSSFLGAVGGMEMTGRRDTTSNAAAVAEADFDLEMDRWMATHGDGHMEDVDAIMEQLARELEEEKAASPGSQPTHDASATANPAAAGIQDGSIRVDARNNQVTPATSTLDRQAVDDVDASIHESDELAVPAHVAQPDYLPNVSRLNLDGATHAATAEPTIQGQSEISEVARQILDSVQHEQGDKWKNSKFLLLMRDFRDGNKDIINNKILETQAESEQPVEQGTTAGD